VLLLQAKQQASLAHGTVGYSGLCSGVSECVADNHMCRTLVIVHQIVCPPRAKEKIRDDGGGGGGVETGTQKAWDNGGRKRDMLMLPVFL